MTKTIKERMDEWYEESAERVQEIVVEMIELDEDFEHRDELLQQVWEIDFTEPDSFDNLARLIEDYSFKSMVPEGDIISYQHTDLINGKCEIYTKVQIKKHEDIELYLEQPWASSAVRKLWKTITCHEFRETWNEGDGLPQCMNILEIVLLIADESAYVPYVDTAGNITYDHLQA